ncbi:MAG: hypothetical protein AAGB19_14645, partial [Cyanobacteria bacterium P01_F01_bin.3]
MDSTLTPPIADSWTEIPQDYPPDLCVVTTVASEFRAVQARLEPAIGDGEKVLQVIAGSVPMLIGQLGGYQAALIQTRVVSPSSVEGVLHVLQSLPSVRLVMVIGIGYGLNPALAETPLEGQMIGDVMVSARCLDLSHCKSVGGSIRPRADSISMSVALSSFFRKQMRDSWSRSLGNWGTRPRPPRVHFGTYLSLPVLFESEEDAPHFAKAAAHLKPIGGDMDLFLIARAIGNLDTNVAWLAIKSISDFGGLIKKPKVKEAQSLAACTAAHFAWYILKTAFLDLLPRKPILQENKQELAFRTQWELAHDFQAYINDMHQLITKAEKEMKPFLIKGWSTAYSRAIEQIDFTATTDQHSLPVYFTEARVSAVKQLSHSLRDFCNQVMKNKQRAVALISGDEESAAVQLGPLLGPLGTFAIRPNFRPSQRTLAALRALSPRVCLLMGCTTDQSDLSAMRRTLRFWDENCEPCNMSQMLFDEFLENVQPECVLLIADNTAENYRGIEGTYLIAWNGSVDTVEACEFLESFLRYYLRDVTDLGLNIVESSYIKATLELPRIKARTRIRLIPCSQ